MKAYKTFYCVMSEFYQSGPVKVKDAIISRACEKKPLNRYREFPGMTAFNDWFETRAEAEKQREVYESLAWMTGGNIKGGAK